MRTLVTGGTGHVGVNLIRRLRAEGHDPVVLVRESSIVDYLPKNIETTTGDITDSNTLESIIDTISPDSVVHLAAASGGLNKASMQGGMDTDVAMKVNVKGTINVYRAAAKAGAAKFVYMSTIKAHPQIQDTDDSPYVESKYKAEQAIEQSEFALEYTSIHPTVIIGPYDFRLHHYHPYQIVHSNRVLVPPLYIPHTANFVPMENVTSTIINCLQTGTAARYVVSGPNIDYRDYIQRIIEASDTRCRVISVPFHKQLIPRSIDFLHERGYLPVSGDAFNWNRSSRIPDKLANRQPFQSKPLTESIQDTYDWYADMELL